MRLNYILKHVFAEVVGRWIRCFAYTVLLGMSFAFCLLSCSPARNVGMGLCSAARPFSLDLIKLCFVSWLASCLNVKNKADITASVVWLPLRFVDTR